MALASLGSVKAQTHPSREVDKILGKGAVEDVKNPQPGYYIWLFLVKKASGG